MEYKLKEILNFHNHKRVPLSKMQRNQKSFSKYPYYGAQGIIDYIDNYIFDGTYLLIAEDGENLRSRKNNIATIAKNKFWVNNHAHILSVKENFNIYYILYLINSMDISGYLTGTVQPKLSKKNLESVILNIPEKNIQDKIGDLIVNIENKINTNDKLIANLEELSQTLFKRWFVDFEFSDENGNPYKSSGGEMTDSELGEIPKAWRVETLEKLGLIVGGGTPSKKNKEYYTNNGIPWITPKDLSKNRNIYISHGENDISELGLNKSSAKLLEKNSVLFSSRAPIGYIAINNMPVTTNQGFKSIVPNEEMNPYFIYFILKNITPLIEQTASGSTFKEISAKGMKSIKIVFPSIELIKQYGNIVKKYFEEINFLENQNIKLIELRDTLLPKLMSGELEIPDDVEVNTDELSI